MKKIVLGLFMALGAVMTYAQGEVLAKVQRIDGKQVYILNEPIGDYQVVGSTKTGLKLGSILTRGLYNEHINDKTTQFTRRAIRKFEKKNIAFDAILYKNGKSIEAIKISEEDRNREIAQVNKYSGMYVFVMAEPLDSYEVRSVVKGGIKIVPFLTYGFVNYSIEKDVKRFVKKASKDGESSLAVSYQSGRRASVIDLQ